MKTIFSLLVNHKGVFVVFI